MGEFSSRERRVASCYYSALFAELQTLLILYTEVLHIGDCLIL